MFERFTGSLEAPKPKTTESEKPIAAPLNIEKKEAPLAGPEQLQNRLQEILRKINILEQRETTARLRGKIKLAEVFGSELTKAKKEQEEIFNKLQAPAASAGMKAKPLPPEQPKTESRRPAAEATKLIERINIGGLEFPHIPYEDYKIISKQIAQETAETERLEQSARRQYDFKPAEMYKQKRLQLVEKQRQILREAAITKSLQKGKLEQ